MGRNILSLLSEPSSVRPSVVVNCSHFWLLWNHWTEFNETWQEARLQRPLPSLCFIGPIGKARWPPRALIDWDIFDFSFKTAKRNATKLDKKQELNVPNQVCVFRADQKNKTVALADPSKRWHIVLRLTIFGLLGLLFLQLISKIQNYRNSINENWKSICNYSSALCTFWGNSWLLRYQDPEQISFKFEITIQKEF